MNNINLGRWEVTWTTFRIVFRCNGRRLASQ